MKVQTFICYKGKSLSHTHRHTDTQTHTLFLGHTIPLQKDSIPARAVPTIKLNKKKVKTLAL